jgi:prolipoprotein diacylglyceryl transferase
MNLILSYWIWTGSPEIFSIGPLTLRWYGLLFAAGFLISQQILYYIYRKEGKPERDVDTLTIYMVVATIIGARLGHVFFYEPQRYLENPIDIIKIWEGGLASHGAAVAILFALWLYSRKKKPGQSYLQVLDRIVILVALTGVLIRTGNFFNSEIIGLPTKNGTGVFFARSVREVLGADKTVVAGVSFAAVDSAANADGNMPIKVLIDFAPNLGFDQGQLYGYMSNRVNRIFATNSYVREHIDQNGPLNYALVPNGDGSFSAIVNTFAIPRHPAQLYEALSYLVLAVILFLMWRRSMSALPPGRIFGWYLIIMWTARFLFEYIKEDQVDFEADMALNMGQWLSIPLAVAGVFVLAYSYLGGNKSSGRVK